MSKARVIIIGILIFAIMLAPPIIDQELTQIQLLIKYWPVYLFGALSALIYYFACKETP